MYLKKNCKNSYQCVGTTTVRLIFGLMKPKHVVKTMYY
jgi:hypothetical protein